MYIYIYIYVHSTPTKYSLLQCTSTCKLISTNMYTLEKTSMYSPSMSISQSSWVS